MRTSNWVGLLLAVLPFSACEPTSNASSSQSADVRNDLRVTRPLGLEFEWQVGEEQGVPFYLVRSVARLPSGSWYVLDAGNHRVWVIDGSGAMVSWFGSEGEGPGEFIDPYSLASSAETVVVTDSRNRLHFFDPAGGLLDTHRVTWGDVGGLYLSQASGVDGEWIVLGEDPGPPLSALSFSFDPTSGTTEFLGLNWEWESPRVASPLFDLGPHAGFAGDHFVVGESDSYEISLLDLGGNLTFSVKNEVEPRVVDESLLETWTPSCTAALEAARECSRRAEENAVRSSLGSTIPSVERLRGFQTGHFAVRRSDVGDDLLSRGQPSHYDYFDPGGVYLGSTAGVIPLYFDGRRVMSLERDELEREYLVSYLIPNAPNGPTSR